MLFNAISELLYRVDNKLDKAQSALYVVVKKIDAFHKHCDTPTILAGLCMWWCILHPTAKFTSKEVGDYVFWWWMATHVHNVLLAPLFLVRLVTDRRDRWNRVVYLAMYGLFLCIGWLIKEFLKGWV